MTQTLGPKGQVVIPKAIRDQFGLRPGDQVVVTPDERGALVQPVARRIPLKGRLAGLSLVEALESGAPERASVRICLDSWAVLRWLEGTEPAATRVDAVMQTRPVMSLLNVGEVFYIVRRARGEEEAIQVIDGLRARVDFDVPSEDRVLAAGRIRADHRMAFADAFAVATSVAHGAVLLTGDPEILDAGGDWQLEDLRSPVERGAPAIQPGSGERQAELESESALQADSA